MILCRVDMAEDRHRQVTDQLKERGMARDGVGHQAAVVRHHKNRQQPVLIQATVVLAAPVVEVVAAVAVVDEDLVQDAPDVKGHPVDLVVHQVLLVAIADKVALAVAAVVDSVDQVMKGASWDQDQVDLRCLVVVAAVLHLSPISAVGG